MGRKTWESIPKKFRPLPGRFNIVITSNRDYEVPEGVAVAGSYNAAILLAMSHEEISDIFICGGTRVYEDALKSNRANCIYLTEIEEDVECDTFFPEYDKEKYVDAPFVPGWDPSYLMQENGFHFKFKRLIRVSEEKKENDQDHDSYSEGDDDDEGPNYIHSLGNSDAEDEGDGKLE